ncbi:MAG: ACT domain-containing protein, partial [Beijerinckiaceae bacterium]
EIRDIKIDAAFAPHMIYVRNADKPGFIGAFGSLMGEANVNIATFNLGRDKQGGDAICFVAVDERVDDALLEKIEAIPQVKRARRLGF